MNHARTVLALALALAAPALASELRVSGVNRAEFWSYVDSNFTTQFEDVLDLNLR